MGTSGASLRRAALLLFPTLIAAYNIDCTNIFVDGQKFDLSSLAGPHYVMTSTEHLPTISNTTYTIDICRPLERPSSVKDGADFCPGGTRVCAVEKTIYTDGATRTEKVIPIAGDLKEYKGGDLDAQLTRLRTSESYADSEKEGVRITMNGGIYEKRKQRTIVEFLCDPNLTGEEGTVPTPEDKPGRKSIVAREEGDAEDGEDSGEKEDGDKDGDQEGGDGGMCMSSMKFINYGPDPSDESRDLLRLEWKTKFACEAAANVVKTGWGFFTWFLLIAFMGTAAYLIFGSWLNYTRYGARGWDLLPHGDTIRDVPYLFKDWSRRVINTVQGGGSRGGYSAV